MRRAGLAHRRATEAGVQASPLAGEEQLASPLLRQQVAERIEQMLVQGRLKPGERLVEADLAQLLGVSRGPVREALQLLEHEGWIENRPRQGATVRRRTAREVEELFDVRRVLEIHAVRLAARNADATGLAQLKALMATCEEAARARDDERLLRLNAEVHQFISDLGGNTSLASMVRSLGRRIRWYTLTPRSPSRAYAVLEEHRELVAAILDQSAEQAAAVMARHLNANWMNYQNWLCEQETAGS
jgi:DNA-binding GntR family transcriptional regulator